MTLETLSPRLREDFITLIAKQTGIEIREQNYVAMGDNIYSRMKELKILTPQSYYDLLTSETPEAEEEWQKFICLITNRESYFFRDKGQFSLLRQTILPDLIRRNQRIKSLRFCSAGCSTGQEPYSLAILLKELIPDIENWNILILGVDINRESLSQAKKAVYNTWSFRQVENDIKQKYFKNSAGYYQLSDDIRNLVKYRQVNLVRDQIPHPEIELYDMDLIICRNVFIYFTENAINQVVEKFFNTLKPNGYLITGHAELNNTQVKAFQTKLFSESIIYQRRSGQYSHAFTNTTSSESFKPQTPLPSIQTEEKQNLSTTTNQKYSLSNNTSNSYTFHQSVNNYTPKKYTSIQQPLKTENIAEKKEKDNDILQEIEQLVSHKSYYLAQRKLEQVLKQFPQHFKATYLMAELEANLGKYESAQKWCQKAFSLDNLQVKPYLLLAQIEEENGNLEAAKNALKKVIYLEPTSFIAYLNLSTLYQQEGDLKRSKKMRQSALKILQNLPLDQEIKELDNIKVGELISDLQDFY